MWALEGSQQSLLVLPAGLLAGSAPPAAAARRLCHCLSSAATGPARSQHQVLLSLTASKRLEFSFLSRRRMPCGSERFPVQTGRASRRYSDTHARNSTEEEVSSPDPASRHETGLQPAALGMCRPIVSLRERQEVKLHFSANLWGYNSERQDLRTCVYLGLFSCFDVWSSSQNLSTHFRNTLYMKNNIISTFP
jgi:hypothetical protein